MTAESTPTPSASKTITVPILGEGIRVARVVSIFKQPGDAVQADDPLCEVETDKAVFPIECDEDGILGEWLIAEDEQVSVGQELVALKIPSALSGATTESLLPAGSKPAKYKNGALSWEVLQSQQSILPATIEMDCRWETVRDARLRSKKTEGETCARIAMVLVAVKHPAHPQACSLAASTWGALSVPRKNFALPDVAALRRATL